MSSEWLLKRRHMSTADVDGAMRIGEVGGIPKIIHQSWKEEELPHKFLDWSNSCRIKHPDWVWVSSFVCFHKEFIWERRI